MNNNIELAHLQIGSRKVFDFLKMHFGNKQHKSQLVHVNKETGEIVLGNKRNSTLDDLVKLSELYPNTYVQAEIVIRFTKKVDRCRYIINDGKCTKTLGTYKYLPSYLSDFG